MQHNTDNWLLKKNFTVILSPEGTGARNPGGGGGR